MNSVLLSDVREASAITAPASRNLVMLDGYAPDRNDSTRTCLAKPSAHQSVLLRGSTETQMSPLMVVVTPTPSTIAKMRGKANRCFMGMKAYAYRATFKGDEPRKIQARTHPSSCDLGGQRQPAPTKGELSNRTLPTGQRRGDSRILLVI